MKDKQKLARITQGVLLLFTLVCGGGCTKGLKMEIFPPVREATILVDYTVGEVREASPGEIVLEVGSAVKYKIFVPKAEHEIDEISLKVNSGTVPKIFQLHLVPEQRWNVLHQTPEDNGIIIEHSSGPLSQTAPKRGRIGV